MISIGIKTEKEIYVAVASENFTLPSAGYKDGNVRVFTLKHHPSLIISHTGLITDYCLFRFKKPPLQDKKDDDFELTPMLITDEILVPFVKNLYEEKILDKDEKFKATNATFIIAKDNKLYSADYHLFISEASDFVTSDIGSKQAEAVLKTISKNNDPIYRILKAMYLTILSKPGSGEYPIVIKSTSNPKKTMFFSLEETMKYIKNYERKVGVKL